LGCGGFLSIVPWLCGVLVRLRVELRGVLLSAKLSLIRSVELVKLIALVPSKLIVVVVFRELIVIVVIVVLSTKLVVVVIEGELRCNFLFDVRSVVTVVLSRRLLLLERWSIEGIAWVWSLVILIRS